MHGLNGVLLGLALIGGVEDSSHPPKSASTLKATIEVTPNNGPIIKNPGPACTLVDLAGAFDGYYPQSSGETYYVKSFPLGDGEVDAQLTLLVQNGLSGVFDLGSLEDIEGLSITLFDPHDDGVALYGPTKGTLTIQGSAGGEDVLFSFDNLRLEELDNGTLDVVPDGQCLAFYNFDLDGYTRIPVGWTCSAFAYSDDVCDCGCGVVDPDCETSSVKSCESCDDPGSCSQSKAMCGDISLKNNATCTEPQPEPLTWFNDVLPIFMARCAACHPSVNPVDVLDYEVLLDDYVTPGSLASSSLWSDWIETNAMPLGSPLENDEKDTVSEWILDGALEN